jgi:hypothetical protein
MAKEVCTACLRTNKIIPLTSLNKYLYNGKSEIKNSNEKIFKKPHRLKKRNERKGTTSFVIIERALLPSVPVP